MKIVRCYWRTDRTCPHPVLCHYGYECVARPKGRAMTTTIAATPIRDVTCWHCGREFETRHPFAGLCPPCERLADEDTRCVPWWDNVHLPDLDETPREMAVRYTIARPQPAVRSRTCLDCGKPYASDDPQDYLCDVCFMSSFV